MKKYIRFGLMILTSTIVMYFLMFVNVFDISHIHTSQTRIYMAILMGAVMTVIMMGFMWKMYENKKANAIIIGAAILTFGASLFMIQNQTGVGDRAWMKAMIPHHSTAILTSENAEITDPRAQKLRDQIIKAQKEEIKEMEKLIEAIEENGEQEE